MHHVWFQFKVMESFLSICCMSFHMVGFLNVELAQDYYMYCAIFFGFTTKTMLGCLNICVGSPPTLLSESVFNSLGFVVYILMSVVSMYHAEKDFYLMYLTEFEEPLHPFFKYSKAQSVSALVCAIMYLLHATLAIDALVFTEVSSYEYGEDESGVAFEPITLYMFGKKIEDRLHRYAWFREFAGIATTQPTEQNQTV